MLNNARKHPIPLHRRFRILFLKWHRTIGIFSAGFMLFLALSGFVLNHSQNFQLDKKFISSPSLLFWYGIKADLNSKGFLQMDVLIFQDFNLMKTGFQNREKNFSGMKSP